MRAKFVNESLNESSTLSNIIPNEYLGRVIKIFNFKHDSELKPIATSQKALKEILQNREAILLSDDNNWAVISKSRSSFGSSSYAVYTEANNYTNYSNFVKLFKDETINSILKSGNKTAYQLSTGREFDSSDPERDKHTQYMYNWKGEFISRHYATLNKFFGKRYTEAFKQLAGMEDDHEDQDYFYDKMKSKRSMAQTYEPEHKNFKNGIGDLREFLNSRYNTDITSYGLYPELGLNLMNLDKKVGRDKLMNEFAQFLVKQKYRN